MRCMKRINVILSDELANRAEEVARRKEMPVADIVRRSLEAYLLRFPLPVRKTATLPVFDLGAPRKSDLRKAVYEARLSETAE